MKKNLLFYLVIAVVVLLVIAVIGKKKGWFGKEEGIKVSAELPVYRTIVETITANGKIQPETEVKISPDVSGEIVGLFVKEGDYVKKGDLLLKIKPDTYVSIKERANASLNSAKANKAQIHARFKKLENDFKNRIEKLWAEELISEAEYDEVKANYEMAKADLLAANHAISSAEASLREATENLNKTTIFAPMEGTITRLNVEFGERVVGTAQMAGTEILRIADLSCMEAKVEVNENDIVRLSLGDTAMVEVDAYLGEKFHGVVTEIANSANSSGATVDQVTSFDVKILLLKESYSHLSNNGVGTVFRPGLSASVDIQTETRYNVLSIPIQAVTSREDSTESEEPEIVVFLVNEQNRSEKSVVRTGVQDDSYIEILAGINDSFKVITGPYSVVSRKMEVDKLLEIVDKKELFKKKE